MHDHSVSRLSIYVTDIIMHSNVPLLYIMQQRHNRVLMHFYMQLHKVIETHSHISFNQHRDQRCKSNTSGKKYLQKNQTCLRKVQSTLITIINIKLFAMAARINGKSFAQPLKHSYIGNYYV